MKYEEAKDILRDEGQFNKSAFLILQFIADLLNAGEELKGQDLLLRSLEFREQVPQYAEIINALIRRTGLFPYIDEENLNLADGLAFEYHRPLHMIPENVVFHRVQARVYRLLLSGFNVVLSAPTSFGKSLLIDALITSGKYNNVVIIVPTIALIDETRRRLSKFKSYFKIITHASQIMAQKNIFVLTQERAVAFNNILDIDLLIVDEFYKLQPGLTQDPKRSTILNHAFYKMYKMTKQFYFLGPNIENIPEGFNEEYESVFIKTDYKTVAADVQYIQTDKSNQIERLIALCQEVDGPTLIYCRSPKRVRDVAEALLESNSLPKFESLFPIVSWLGENYSSEWLFPNALLSGIGLHHGQVPRSLSHLAVRLFNDDQLKFLICTSTLIEGVNTKAKNVIVLDNTVAMQKYDYFTFNNICGRSGRMFVHFVGNVYLFNPPPESELPYVDIPLYTQDEHSPFELLIQLDEEDLREESRERLQPFIDQDYLPLDILRENSGIDPGIQIEFAKYLHKNFSSLTSMLCWTGFPSNKIIYSICDLMWDSFFKGSGRVHGISSGKQLAFKLLQASDGISMNKLIEHEINNDYHNTKNEAVESVFDFIRYWMEFTFPNYLMAINRIQNYIYELYEITPGDYSYFTSLVENFFLPPPMLALEEFGIPLPLIQKISHKIKFQGDSLDAVLEYLRQTQSSSLSDEPIEIEFIDDAKQAI